MDRLFRYLNLLKQAHYGLSLPKGALYNFLCVKSGNVSEYIGFGKATPPMISIITERRCNLKCSFCICAGFPRDWQEYTLTPEKLSKILQLNMVKKSMLINFSGGEPLLNNNLEILIKMSRQEKHLTGMISNGLLLEERATDLAKAGLSDTQISIYDVSKKQLANIFPKVSHLLPIHASYVLLKSTLENAASDNFNSLIDIIRMTMDTGCSSLKFNLCEPMQGSNDFSETITDADENYTEFISRCKAQVSSVKWTGFACAHTVPSRKFTVFFPNPTQVKVKERLCRTPWRTLILDANGNYGICCRLQPVGNKYGNVFDDGEIIINSNEALSIRQCLLNNRVSLVPECVQCVHLSGSYGSQI